MSNYTIVTNYLAKDSLISGNPAKLIKGADFTTEFTAVQTAVNSKPDGTVQFFPDGTAVQPSVGFTNNAGTGMFNAAGVLGFATNGISRATIAVAGNVTINAPTGGVAFTVNAVSGQASLILKPADSASVGFQITDPGANSVQFRANTNNTQVVLQALGAAGTQMVFSTQNVASALTLINGATLAGATGGDQGSGNFNAVGLFINGVQIYSGFSLNTQASNYILALTDQNKMILFGNAAGTVTVPTNASVAFPIGSVVCIYNNTAGNITIPTAGDTVRFGPTGSSGTRTLAQNGVATLVKLASTVWVITGTGLT